MSYPEADALTAEVVAQYLQDHPDFFQTRSELVSSLQIPHQQQGAVSLVEIQMRRQRQRIEELEEEITTLMSLAASNDRTFHDFMQLQEQILQCDYLEEAITCVTKTAVKLGLQGWVKLLDSAESRHQLSTETYQRFAMNHFNGKPAYLGRMKSADREALFGDERVPEMGSYVVLPMLSRQPFGKPLGLVAFASEDGGHFQPNMDTLFLRHLCLVLAHMVQILPWRREEKSAHVSHTTAQ
ncbi:DUF484 family protein [Vibrio sp. SCSIO 43136]|uniref:DUF484 family protein n=1 Tax=Vibrio sp. SCSIO 43136 TaxID=2819101 RepID=UPI002075ACB9|nr:DUF484 family protein [Vibrio sp. SCSIO 43136]USD65367.1 DUF484 family protein [Vibrio sp. SCSIO 43136]